MIIGTLTSGAEQEYLMIAKTRLPINEKLASDVKDFNNKDAIAAFSKAENKIEIETKINHQGEVNKARVMPQPNKYNIIATKTPSGEVHIFDYFKHPPRPATNEVKTELKLYGHTKEGFGLNWSTLKEGYLLSGSNDGIVCMWDINSGSSEPLKSYHEHSSECNDVSFNKKVDNIMVSCGDDKKIIMYDYRQNNPVLFVDDAHDNEVNSVDFNPLNEFLLISSSTDKTCALWDMRNLKIKLHTFAQHSDKVIGAKWNMKKSNLFASFSDDRRVMVWDVSQIGATIASADNEDGPSELIVRRLLLFNFLF